MTEFEYRKSSYSDPEAECVEIATNIPTVIAIRDSKNPCGSHLRIHPTVWSAFQALLTHDALSQATRRS
ncbi:DUF397 domain-containing protein [Streptomyces sp. V4I2]|uniref:DUF397 domain-containing protein n=1 Tax=Streptomyces sp. V4I2 TaxID=3042280 RepID=UPI00278ABD9F|nr:DUF397 domain-containing protein [Streptomyces sp. V4I2]MDQ1045344.1 hypothetical protein [Streptomyces sp. V4I2]